MGVNVPLHEAVMMATEKIRASIGLEAKGCLKVDADADLVVLSPELEVLANIQWGPEIWSGYHEWTLIDTSIRQTRQIAKQLR